MRLTKRILLLSTGLTVIGVAGFAATSTGTLLVTAAVLDTCLVVATPLAFGDLDGSAATAELAPAVVTVTCTSNKTGLTVDLGEGGNASAGQRYMVSVGGQTLPYDIYTDSGHSAEVAVDGEIFNGDVTAVIPTAISVYGMIPEGDYNLGAYTDTVTITVTY